MSNIADLLRNGVDILKSARIVNADLDAWYLLEYVFGMTKVDFLMNSTMQADKGQAAEYMNLIEERKNRRPLQYIIGTWEFMGLKFKVNEAVLIPRQETELLVEKALSCMGQCQVHSKVKILDLCTGSGCIAISISQYAKVSVKVEAADISVHALQVARGNAADHNCDINFIQSDCFEEINGKYNMIVSNPPYITSDDMKELMPEVRDYEPVIALDGDLDGLKFYRIITENSIHHLEKYGWILYETGYNQGKAVSDILMKNGFINVEIICDLAGFDRIVCGQYCN